MLSWVCYGILLTTICHWLKILCVRIFYSFRNGSLVRDVFKRADANNNWDCFSEMLDSTPRGNGGNMALHFHSVEIIPSVEGTLRWGPEHSLNCSDASVGLAKWVDLRECLWLKWVPSLKRFLRDYSETLVIHQWRKFCTVTYLNAIVDDWLLFLDLTRLPLRYEL